MSRANKLRRFRNATVKRAGPAGIPTFATAELLPLVELPPSARDQAMFINAVNSYLRLYRLGECMVVVTKGWNRWHLSISHKQRDPTWFEISSAWYRIIPGAADLTAALLLPPLREYVNITEHCFQIHEIDDPEASQR